MHPNPNLSSWNVLFVCHLLMSLGSTKIIKTWQDSLSLARTVLCPAQQGSVGEVLQEKLPSQSPFQLFYVHFLRIVPSKNLYKFDLKLRLQHKNCPQDYQRHIANRYRSMQFVEPPFFIAKTMLPPRVRHLLPLRRVDNISEALEERARHQQMPQYQTPVKNDMSCSIFIWVFPEMAYTKFMITCMLHFRESYPESCPRIIPAKHTTNHTHDFEAMFWNINCFLDGKSWWSLFCGL